MSGATVRCPKCGKAFRIANRKLLGRSGKCSGCGAQFTLKEAAPENPAGRNPIQPSPSSVERSNPSKSSAPTLARPSLSDRKIASIPRAAAGPPRTPEPALPAAAAEPLVGVNARWVPDKAHEEVFAPAAAAPMVSAARPPEALTSAPFAAESSTDEPPVDAAAGIAARRKLRKQKQQRMVLGGIGGAVVLAIVVAFVMSRGGSGPPANDVLVEPQDPETASQPTGPYSREMLEGNLALLDEFRPTRGEPISLKYVPNGVNLVVHLRPAELWGKDRAAAELRASLTEGVVAWLEQAIKTHCHRAPEQISEVTFAFVMGAFGTEPRSAVVVTLKDAVKPSVLLDEFGGKLLDDDVEPRITVGETTAHVLVDDRTFAIAPADTATELQDALKQPNGYVSKNLIELLKQSDHERLLTIAVEIPDLKRHVTTLFPESAQGVAGSMLDWMGDDVDALAWTLSTKPTLHSQFVLHPKAGVSSNALRTSLQKKLDTLPQDMLAIARRTNPQQAGFRNLIGRFPAMLEAVRQSTVLHVGPQQVEATTVLPTKAAPNLALGALLTWNELSRSGSPAGTESTSAAESRSVADLLKTPVLIEFPKTPLEQVVNYIGDQAGFKFVVDGEGLERAGYTRNMEQSLSLGTVPAIEAVKAMLSVPNQSDLAVYIDEANKTAVMSSKAYLREQGKTPLAIP